MSNTTNNKYFNRFCEALIERGLTYEEVQRDYKYSGGSCGTEEDLPNEHSRYFDLCFPHDNFPDKVSNCICDHPIKKNCYISKDFKYDTIIILGICCIKRFQITSSRTCLNCSAPHKNRSLNYCNSCKECAIRGFTKKCTSCKSLCRYLSKTGKCEKCSNGSCFTCNKKIDPKFKNCYNCNLIKK
jgi:hypothetical protein